MPGLLHSRRAGRHSRDREPTGLRALSEQPLDLARRHVAFDGIAFDHRGVAAAQVLRYACLATEYGGVGDVQWIHTEPVRAEVVTPRDATASSRVLVQLDAADGLGFARRNLSRACSGDREGEGRKDHQSE